MKSTGPTWNPPEGRRWRKSRPVVIVSLDILNQQLQTVTVCPLTTSIHPAWRSGLQVRIGRRNAEIAVDQIRTISKSRLRSRVGVLSKDEAALFGESSRRCTGSKLQKEELSSCLVCSAGLVGPGGNAAWKSGISKVLVPSPVFSMMVSDWAGQLLDNPT